MKSTRLLTVLSMVAFIAVGLASCKKDEDKVTIYEPVKYSGEIAVEEAVDLGLSVYWAGYNIGAERPEQIGSYFCWAETSVKEEDVPYEEANWKYWDEVAGRLKYNAADKIDQIAAEDDAATAAWGDDYRIPTQEEIQELIDGCNWTYAKYNGVTGWVATKKPAEVEEGDEEVEEDLPSIFFPDSGYKVAQSLQGKSRGIYLSASLYATGAKFAFTFVTSDRGVSVGSLDVFYGGQIRAVKEKGK